MVEKDTTLLLAMASISQSLDLSTLNIRCNDGNPGTNHPSQESCLKAPISSTTSKAPILDFPNRILKEYLRKNEDIFHDLDEVREKVMCHNSTPIENLTNLILRSRAGMTRKVRNSSKNFKKAPTIPPMSPRENSII